MSIHLGDSFDYVFTFVNNAQNEIFNQNKKRIKKSAKEIIFDVQGVDITNQELETLEKHEMLKIVGKKKFKLQQKTEALQS